MMEERADKVHTLKATESVLEYLTHDTRRHGFDGLLLALNAARSYCADLLRFMGENTDPGAPEDAQEEPPAKRRKAQ